MGSIGGSNPSFVSRMKVGGDLAEKAFEDYCQKHGMQFERYGFDRAQLPTFRYLNDFIKHTPDYVATKGRAGSLWECKGCGRGNYVNLKPRDIEAYRTWNELSPLFLFLNDTKENKIAAIAFDDFIEKWDVAPLEVKTWDDGVEYIPIPKTWFVWEDKDE